jgi:hypothetical protein
VGVEDWARNAAQETSARTARFLPASANRMAAPPVFDCITDADLRSGVVRVVP